MAAVDSDVTPAGPRQKFEVVETIDIDNVAAAQTINRALAVPDWAVGFTCLLDITITGTTPLFDFTISGGTVAGGRRGATLDSTTDKFEFTAGGPMTITQLTTDTSTPITTIACGPAMGYVDTTGSATANSCYAFACAGLPPYLIYTYVTDAGSDDEDYNGTISFIWHKK